MFYGSEWLVYDFHPYACAFYQSMLYLDWSKLLHSSVFVVISMIDNDSVDIKCFLRHKQSRLYRVSVV